MFDVSLKLLCTRKSGTLSRIVREINLLGLQYQSHNIETDDKHSHITINASGDLNCSPEDLQEMFLSFSEVLAVEQFHLTRNGKDVTQIETTVSDTKIPAHELLTPAIVLAAEKRLSDILGPVASFIVESTAIDSANAGELFSRLADELNDQSERDHFLSIIEKFK